MHEQQYLFINLSLFVIFCMLIIIYLIFFMVFLLNHLGHSWLGLSTSSKLIIFAFVMIKFDCSSNWKLTLLVLFSLGPYLNWNQQDIWISQSLVPLVRLYVTVKLYGAQLLHVFVSSILLKITAQYFVELSPLLVSRWVAWIFGNNLCTGRP